MRMSWVAKMDRWVADPGFRKQTLAEASEALQELLPGYPGPNEAPLAICKHGYRWYAKEMEAVADAIYRASKRGSALSRTLEGPDWDVECNQAGQWSVPGQCSPSTLPRAQCESTDHRPSRTV